MKNIVKQEVWDESYQNFKFHIENDRCSNKFKEIYNMYLKNERLTNCFELGCFPWRYLAYICKLWNLEANWADITSQLNDSFVERLNSNKIKVWKVVKSDVFDYIDELCKNGTCFDLVYSLGFIEHFTDFLNVIDYHIKIAKKKGFIYITTPNFAWWYQKFMHSRLDKPNYDNHIIESMDPKKWAHFLEQKNCKVIEYWYFWNFDFWVENFNEKSLIKKMFIYLNIFIAKLWILFPNRRFYSPYCYIIAQKL